MMLQNRFLLVLLFVCFATFGCVSTGDFARSQYDLVQRIGSLEKHFKSSEESANKNLQSLRADQADKGVEIEALKNRIREMRGALDELKVELANYREIKAQMGMFGDKVNQFHNRLSVIESNIATGAVATKSSADVVLTKGGNATLEAMSSDKTRKEMSSLYSGAYNLFKQRRFDRARADFSELLQRFPNSEYSADAIFWIAESYFLEKDNEKAILEYEKVIKNYPGSNKISSAMLKQGMAFVRLGDTQSAQIIFRQIIQAFPNTTQARSAQLQLNEIK